MRLALAFCLAILPSFAQTTAANLLESKLRGEIEAVALTLNGVLGVTAIDLETGHKFSFHGEALFAQASSIKIPILIELFRAAKAGEVNLDSKLTLHTSDSVGGSGHLQTLLRSGDHTLTVLQLATAMIETSDNTATNKIIGMLGMDKVNANLRQMGFTETKLQRIMLDSGAATAGRENISTPDEMALMAEMLYRGKAVDAESSKRMIELLKLVDADFRSAIPASVAVAAKPGSVTGVKCETGIVYLKDRPFVLSVMSAFLDDGINPVAAVTRKVYEHFQKLASSNAYGNRVR